MNRFLFFFFLVCYIASAQKPQIQNFEFNKPLVSSHSTIDKQNNQWQAILADEGFGSLEERSLSLVKTDSCNTIVWSKRYTYNTIDQPLFHNIRGIISVPNSDDIIVVGMSYANNGHTSPIIICFSSDGELRWTKRYEFTNLYLTNSYGIFQNENEFILPCKMAKIGGGAAYSSFLRFGYDGDYIESPRFADSYTGLSVIQLNDSEFLWRSHNQLARTTLSGEVVWAKAYSSLLNGSNFFPGIELDHRAIFHVNVQNQRFLVGFDLDGNYLWQSDQLSIETWPQFFQTQAGNLGLVHSLSIPKQLAYSVFDPKDGSLDYSKSLNSVGFNSGANFPNVIQKNEKTYLNYLFDTQHTHTLIDLERMACFFNLNLELIENQLNTDFTDISSGFYTGKIELLQVEDFELTTSSISVDLTTHCVNPIAFDTTKVKAYIDCDVPFQIENPDLTANYYWLHNGSTNPYEELTEPGTYEVFVDGCSSRIELIDLTSICDCRLTFPTAFSPNGDGLNDGFGPVDNCGIEFYKLKIWDRWGKLLFESDVVDQAWDGRFGNKPLSSGVYVYEVIYSPLSIKASEHLITSSRTFVLNR
ncbi:MAG: T9SS type B sorting domain-containing protein [Flavobacteriales bacterium]